MASKEWTDEEVQAEIKEAVRIVNEDRERATYAQLHERYGEKPKSDPKDGPPPPKNDDPTPTEKKRRSLWWGDRLDDAG